MGIPMIEVKVTDTEIAIYLDKKKFRDWLIGNDREQPVPWEEGNEEEQEKKRLGYKDKDGNHHDFPSPAKGDYPEEEPDGDPVDKPETVDLFGEGPTGQSGTLEEASGGKEMVKEFRDWLKKEKFNYRNFCLFLHQLDEVAGFKLSCPPIGVTPAKKEPTLLKLALRYYSYWKSAKDQIAKEYKRFLINQLEEIGVKIELVKDIFDGEEIDPKNLPENIFEK